MKKTLKYTAIFLLLLLSGATWYLYNTAPVAAGYSAKYLCSHVFTSGQDAGEAMKQFVEPINPVFGFVDYDVDYERKQVTANLFGFLRPATAVYRPGCGCTLLVHKSAEELKQQTAGLDIEEPALKDTVWPFGNRFDRAAIPAGVDTAALNRRIAREFRETAAEAGDKINTFAIVVAYKDRIIAEQYRPGITDSTPLLSWSASKSVTGALFGRLVQTHGLNIYAPVGLPAWQNDERRAITINQLLRMESGLAFDERYAPFADAVEMLYESADMGAYAAAKKALTGPDSIWAYSSGTTNILAKILLEKTGGSLRALDTWAHEQFFDKIGMRSAIFEHGENGAYVGSSYFYATPKDWLRFALLYKQKGRWNGEQLLPPGWVDYSLSPTLHAPLGEYGAHIWLNGGRNGGSERFLPRLPPDAFFFEGYQEQWIVVIPSKDLMIARFGATNTPNWSVEDLVVDVVKAVTPSVTPSVRRRE